MGARIPISQERIGQYCQKHRIRSLALFGSVLREDFRPGSDLDVLVEFAPGVRPRFFELAAMREELEAIVGRKVDLVEKRVVECSENYIRRDHILRHAEPIYVAR